VSGGPGGGGAAPALDVAAVRAQFASLRRNELAFLDAPAGSQVPDAVIDAIADYLRTSNANSGGAFATSNRTDALTAAARAATARFLGGCSPEEITFGASTTALNFHLSRTAAREFVAGDEIVCTRLDHDSNIAPWLELAHDKGLVVRLADFRDDGSLDLDSLAALIGPRTKVVACTWASNALGTVNDIARVSALAHEAGALAWIDAVHYAPHGPIDVRAAGADVLFLSAYKVYGPHLGVAFARAELHERWRPYKVRPAEMSPLGHRHELGTLPFELVAEWAAAIAYVEGIGWDAIRAHERALGERFLSGLPANVRLHGLPTMDGRVSTFFVSVDGVHPSDAARRLAERGFAVWDGSYYAHEVMPRLGLPDGAVRIGFVHYNSPEEVDGVLAALADME
jgi:cysteine desulfurase family protein (TIGR01976 family)